MSDEQKNLRDRLVEVGLEDPMIRAIAGLVVVAVAASSVISLLGDGVKAVLAIGLSTIFGVILVILRVLIKNVDGVFIKVLCYVISGTITFVFVLLIVFVVPAVVSCWPAAYRDVLGLKACPAPMQVHEAGTGFTPVAFSGPAFAVDPTNAAFTLLVFYRPERHGDAERVVGAFLSAGFKSQGVESTLDEVLTDDHSPGSTLIKLSAAAQGAEPRITALVGLAIPLAASRTRVAPGSSSLRRGDGQIDLF